MPLSSDVAAIVEELLRADLAWLAAEVIEAIELPQPTHVTSGDAVDHPRLAGFQPGLETKWDVLETARLETPPNEERAPDLSDAQQLVLVADILEIRLVQPAYKLAEAERIAGRLEMVGVIRGEGRTDLPRGRSKPVRFHLQALDGRTDTEGIDLQTVGELAVLLREISGRAPKARTRDGQA